MSMIMALFALILMAAEFLWPGFLSSAPTVTSLLGGGG